MTGIEIIRQHGFFLPDDREAQRLVGLIDAERAALRAQVFEAQQAALKEGVTSGELLAENDRLTRELNEQARIGNEDGERLLSQVCTLTAQLAASEARVKELEVERQAGYHDADEF